MDATTLRSYLVSLGFAVDQTQFRKFDTALRSAARTVEFHTGGVARELLKWQAGIVGAFGAISGAIIGVGERVSMQDQQYRLLGLRMFMTQESAKKLQIALDALGATQEEVAFDPELHKRFLQLMNDQGDLQKQLGGSFKNNMIAIRDLRFEFTRLHVALQYLTMGFVNSLFRSMGMSAEDVKLKIQTWVNWLMGHLPELSDQLADHVVPILKDLWLMLKAIGGGLQAFGMLFTNTVGLLSGDDSIVGTTSDFEKFAAAIQHVVHFLSMMVQYITLAEKMLLHLGNAAVLALGGHMKEAAEEFRKSLEDLSPKTGAIAGGVIGSIAGGFGGVAAGAEAGPVGMLLGGIGGAALGAIKGGATGYLAGAAKEGISPSDRSRGDWAALNDASQATFENLRKLSRGIRNNNPGNLEYGNFAREHGATGRDPRFAVFDTPQQGLAALADLLRNYQQKGIDTTSSIISKFAPPNENDTQSYIAQVAKSLGVGSNERLNLDNSRVMSRLMDAIIRVENGSNPYSGDLIAKAAEGRAYMDRAAQYPGYQQRSAQATQVVDIGGVQIHINQPGASQEQIQSAVTSGIRSALSRQNQLDIAQLSPAF